jgi:hypothetical protein
MSFGRTAGAGAAGLAGDLAAVPEPASLVLLILATVGPPTIPRRGRAAKNRF